VDERTVIEEGELTAASGQDEDGPVGTGDSGVVCSDPSNGSDDIITLPLCQCCQD